ncbi:hypothetical protein WJX84_008542 [Apatococcus fuscideae]|uniref:Nas2 N-terminal domain-containing protein n=1 Tax=Apatococcus fuscideae TaxID=2026836 RepID=A0AAW1SQS7_9CHLO
MSSTLKAGLKQLMNERDSLEADISERSARLDAAGVGLAGKLVDKEGFPRADIDVAGLRADRQRIIVLSNDHKALTAKVEQLLQQLHADSRSQKLAGSSGPMEMDADPPAEATSHPEPPSSKRPHLDAYSSSQDQMTGSAFTSAAAPFTSSGRPFAVVDEVAAGSPAAAAGVQLGDQWLSFGSPDGPKATSLPSVAAALQDFEGRAATAEFLRRGLVMRVQLTPGRWSGRGLLGCHLQALPP